MPAIFLRTGIKGKSAVDHARDLLKHFGSLSALCAAGEAELCAVPGIKQAKFVQLQAVMEMARRALKEKITHGDALNSPAAVREYLRLQLQALPHEVFVALFLDAQNRVIEIEELFRGTLNQTSVYPREVVKRALHQNSAAIIFAILLENANHPTPPPKTAVQLKEKRLAEERYKLTLAMLLAIRKSLRNPQSVQWGYRLHRIAPRMVSTA